MAKVFNYHRDILIFCGECSSGGVLRHLNLVGGRTVVRHTTQNRVGQVRNYEHTVR